MTSNVFVSITAALLLAMMSSSAQAFFDPPWITPAAPRAGETVSVNIRGGICDGVFEHPGFPQITRQGNSVRLLEYGHHWDSSDLCIYDIGTLAQPIGAFPPGNYTLTVDFVYPDVLGPTVITLGSVPFAVTGASIAAPVPLEPSSKFLLVVLVACAALSRLWTRLARHLDR